MFDGDLEPHIVRARVTDIDGIVSRRNFWKIDTHARKPLAFNERNTRPMRRRILHANDFDILARIIQFRKRLKASRDIAIRIFSVVRRINDADTREGHKVVE